MKVKESAYFRIFGWDVFSKKDAKQKFKVDIFDNYMVGKINTSNNV